MDCTCGPGPLGGRGWRADCPSHNVRALLIAPPKFDPTTIAARVAALTEENTMTTPTTARKPETYAQGFGEHVRAIRLYIGLSQRDMADRVGKDRRDYQRIENGRDACPPGLLSQMETLADAFDTQIDAVLAAAKMADESGVGPMQIAVITDGRPEHEWQRLVAGRAAAEERPNAPIVLVAYASAEDMAVGQSSR